MLSICQTEEFVFYVSWFADVVGLAGWLGLTVRCSPWSDSRDFSFSFFKFDELFFFFKFLLVCDHFEVLRWRLHVPPFIEYRTIDQSVRNRMSIVCFISIMSRRNASLIRVVSSLESNCACPKGQWWYLVAQNLHVWCCALCDLIDQDQETACWCHKELPYHCGV